MQTKSVPLSKLSWLVAAVVLCLTTGCFETKQEFTLNPDGSGKVIHECSFTEANFVAEKKLSAEDSLRAAVRKVIEKSKGVDAWRDVSFKLQDNGRFLFRGTAYFKDLSKLDFPNQTLLKFDWKKGANGTATLTLRTNKSDDTESGGIRMKRNTTPASTNKLSPEELTKKIREDRMAYQQGKPMLTAILASMKQSVTLHLPGKVSSSANFTRDPSGSIGIRFEGAKLLQIAEQRVNDDEWCRRHNGAVFDKVADGPVDDSELNELVYGEKAPVHAVVVLGSAPAFDYATEVAAAKKESAKIEKELEVVMESAPSIPVPATQGSSLKSLRIVGVRLVTQADEKRQLRPFHEDAHFALALLAEFPGSVVSITDKTLVEVAQADDGTSLLLESDWSRAVRFPQLASDKTAAILEFKLKVPGKDVRGLKELSGKIQYKVSSGTKEVDLGLPNLKAGARGTALGVEIESIKEGWQKDGSQQMQLTLKLQPDDIRALKLVAEDGTRTELKQNGYGGGGNSYSFTYEFKKAVPEKGRLVAEVNDKTQVFDAPFKLQNISLLGGSLEAK